MFQSPFGWNIFTSSADIKQMYIYICVMQICYEFIPIRVNHASNIVPPFAK